MKPEYTLHEANAILPLVRQIAAEISERRPRHRELERLRLDLESAATPESLAEALDDIDFELFSHRTAIDAARRELESLGLHVLRMTPLTVHIPGRTRQGPLVFCWQVDEEGVNHGHAVGEEKDPRRPLRVRASH